MSARLVIDTAEFARTQGELSGELPVAEFTRLADVLAGGNGSVGYRLRGQRVDGQPRLDLTLQAKLQLTCQRCLTPVPFALDVNRGFVLVAREEDLGELADESDDIDEIVASGAFDVLQLLEDELLLALPVAPRHQSCELVRAGDAQQNSKFAALAALKGKLGAEK